ncbi:hypothetical protein Lal_00016682 [Lupinus albus]|nr:hypothetical protein Lal_00016682 [Lupinus albus]
MHKQMALSETIKSRDILSARNLNLEDCLLHYLMYALKHNIPINWTLMSKILLDAREIKIDVDVIQKMGFLRDPIYMINKHRSDQQTAHTENPSVDSPIQQPFAFQIESSSSASIPTNQMMMD